MTAPLDLTAEDGRYHRQELISWWDQSRLLGSRVLVVGAGALGNEIAKNLALLGVGTVEIVDMDTIENSNLARCVLFRDADTGRAKAEVVAERISEINPDVTARAHTVKVERLGLGYLRHFDLVIAGLDNREARLWVGTACRKLGLTWIDGAIEGLRGLARVFPPTGACYECTLGEQDREVMSARKSCALLTAEQMAEGKVPTNSTSASLIAAIEVQEAVKVLVGRSDLVALNNKAFMYTGDVMDTYTVTYDEDEYCLSHDRYVDIAEFAFTPATTAADVLRVVPDGELVFEDDLVVSGRCADCGETTRIERFLSTLGAGAGECACGGVLALDVTRNLAISDPLSAVPISTFAPALEELVTIRTPAARWHVALTVPVEER